MTIGNMEINFATKVQRQTYRQTSDILIPIFHTPLEGKGNTGINKGHKKMDNVDNESTDAE